MDVLGGVEESKLILYRLQPNQIFSFSFVLKNTIVQDSRCNVISFFGNFRNMKMKTVGSTLLYLPM